MQRIALHQQGQVIFIVYDIVVGKMFCKWLPCDEALDFHEKENLIIITFYFLFTLIGVNLRLHILNA